MDIQTMQDLAAIVPQQDVNSKLQEMVEIAEELKKHEQVGGFHYSFYVPGWIGFFQQINVEAKIEKFKSSPLIGNRTYADIAQVIIDNTSDIVKSLVNYEETLSLDSEKDDYNVECLFVTNTILYVRNTWLELCPEAALYYNIKVADNQLANMAGIVFRATEQDLNRIGYNAADSKYEKTSSFWKDTKDTMKNVFYNIAGYIINILTLACIFGLLGAIFG